MSASGVSLVVATARDGVIGRDGDLPWHLPEDLRHFKRVTMGHAVIMGRKTWDSIAARLGGPLPGRRNLVLSRQPDLTLEGAEVVRSVAEALDLARAGGDDEPMVIGGASVYEAALPLATRVYRTEIDRAVDGDTWFPTLDPAEWEERERRPGKAEDVAYLVLERRG